MSTHNHENHGEVPKTITPWTELLIWNGSVLTLTWIVMLALLAPMLGLKAIIWASILNVVLLGLLIGGGTISVEIPDYHGVLLFNPWSKTRRVVFPGLNWKLPWEALETGTLRSLRKEVSFEGKILSPTNDPAETMEVEILIHMLLNLHGSPHQVAENFLKLQAVEEHGLVAIVKAQVIAMVVSFFGKSEMEGLLDVNRIRHAIFESEENRNTISALEEKYGVHIGIELRGSRPDEKTAKLKTLPAKAEALRVAIDKLSNGDMMSLEEAKRVVMLADLDTAYSEEVFRLDIQAPDLRNLRNVTVTPGLLKPKGGKK